MALPAKDHDTLETEKPEWLTLPEGAAYLRVAKSTLYRWIRQGRLPLYHLGEKVARVKRADLDALAHSGPSSADRQESQFWTTVSQDALNELWDNEEDAIYDNWREYYALPAR